MQLRYLPNHWPSTPQAITDAAEKRKRRADRTWCYYREPNGGERTKASDGLSLMYCALCKSRPIHFTAISGNVRKYLDAKRQIQVEVGELKGKKARQIALNISSQHATKKRVDEDATYSKTILRNVINKEAFIEAQTQLITSRRIAFNCVEWAEYQALLMSTNPEVEDFLIESHTTIPIHTKRSFITHRKTITARLQGAVSQIHYGTDLSSSPNRKSFLGICAQFVDSEYKLQKALLALPQVSVSHSGETPASHILDTLQAYNIAEETGYIVGDNAQAMTPVLQPLQKGSQD